MLINVIEWPFPNPTLFSSHSLFDFMISFVYLLFTERITATATNRYSHLTHSHSRENTSLRNIQFNGITWSCFFTIGVASALVCLYIYIRETFDVLHLNFLFFSFSLVVEMNLISYLLRYINTWNFILLPIHLLYGVRVRVREWGWEWV